MKGLNERALKDLHEESVGWKSELEFCQDEYNFFEKLLNSYKYVPDNKEDFEMREDLLRSFSKLRETGMQAYDILQEHINRLGGIYEEGGEASGSPYLKEHESVKQRMGDFKKDFRAFKKKLFILADRILEHKKPDGLKS